MSYTDNVSTQIYEAVIFLSRNTTCVGQLSVSLIHFPSFFLISPCKSWTHGGGDHTNSEIGIVRKNDCVSKGKS